MTETALFGSLKFGPFGFVSNFEFYPPSQSRPSDEESPARAIQLL